MKAEITEEIKQGIAIAKISEGYKDYTYFDKTLDHPVPFNELMEDEDIDYVGVHSLSIAFNNILGFCGKFSWKDNTLESLDCDLYNSSMLVYGYKWFTYEDGKRGVSILVGNDW